MPTQIVSLFTRCVLSETALLQINGVHKSYEQLAEPVTVLRGVNLSLKRGESLAIMGPSGSGKSTLLHIIGTLDEPGMGSISIDGRDPFSLSEPDLARFRNRVIGFVFQDHHLLPQYSVLENVLLPTHAFPDKNQDETRARQLLERVGLEHRLEHRPAELSGGERQRVAIARALINAPGLLLCDEPTGNLDGKTADAVAQLLFDLHREENNVLVMVTHSPELAQKCDRSLWLKDGQLVDA